MLNPFQWHCPFCDRDTTIAPDRHSVGHHYFNHGNKDGPRFCVTEVVVCPNPECSRFSLTATLTGTRVESMRNVPGEVLANWALVPAAQVRVFPDYIPEPILADYREACLIRDLSPKASATLSRRCLQGMIRDFWSIRKGRLVDEIDALYDKVDPTTWSAIDAVRKLGNIGAHMEKDINLVVDVEPEEAGLLIGLIETLLSDWYVARHVREERMSKLVAASSAKTPQKAVATTSGK